MSVKTAKQILDGLGDRDPDLREMACRDLDKILNSGASLTPNEELQLANRFLEMMTKDQSLKVLASHTLVDLLNKSVTAANIQQAVTTGIALLLGSHEEDEKTIFEVATSFIKGLIVGKSGQPSFSPSIVYERTIPALRDDKHKKIVEYVLDLLETLLVNWGSYITQDAKAEKVFDDIQNNAMPYLKSPIYNIQTKAIGCVGNVGAYLSFDAFDNLIKKLRVNLEKEKEASGACTALSSLSTICRLSPNRFAKAFPALVPLLSQFVQATDFPEEADQVKVSEAALTVFENALVHCPTSATVPHLKDILDQVLQFIGYDPTVIEGNEDDNAAEDIEIEENEDDGVVDESETWRVRKACIKCLGSMANKWTEGALTFLDQVGEELLKRFTDNQVNVKIEAFKTFGTIVSLIKNEIKTDDDFNRFYEWIPEHIVKKRLMKQLKEKSQSDKAKIEAYALIQEIANINEIFSEEAIAYLNPGIVVCLKDKSENLKIASAKALNSLITNSNYSTKTFKPFIKDLTEAIIVTVSTQNFKVVAAALRTVSSLTKVIEVDNDIVRKLYSSVALILGQESAASEVKEAVITAIGHIIATHGKLLGKDIEPSIKTLGDRLNHATTCVAAAKAIQTIAQVLPLGSQTGILAQQLVESLKLNNRLVRQSSLEALIALVNLQPFKLPNIDAISTFIEPDDLLLTNLTLKLFANAIKADNSLLTDVLKIAVPKLVAVLPHSVLQGGSVGSVPLLFQSIIEVKGDLFDELFKTLVGLRKQGGSESIATAQAIAAISSTKPKEIVVSFLGEAKAGDVLAINTLGEIGSRVDITDTDVIGILTAHLVSTGLSSSAGVGSDKSVKYLSARALGNILSQNLKLALLKDLTPKAPQHVVVLIRQLLEKIPSASLKSHSETIVDVLLTISEKSDVTRDTVADAIAKLIQADHNLSNLLLKLAQSDNKNKRVSITKGVSLAVNQSPNLSTLSGLTEFLPAIKDKEVDVRIAGLGLLMTFIDKNPALLKSLVPTYQELIFIETKRRPELISKVTVGNNTIVTDLGLPSRRAAFQIIERLLNLDPDLLPVDKVIAALGAGSKVDEEVEIQLLAHKLSVKVANLHPEQTLKSLALFDLTPTFIKVLPNTAIEVDVKAHEEIINSARQVAAAIEDILYGHKYIGKAETINLLEVLVKTMFGGLKATKLYKEIKSPLEVPAQQPQIVKILTELWKSFDGKLQNNIAHKPLAEDIITGLEDLIESYFKKLADIKNDDLLKASLTLIKIIDLDFVRLEKFKADMKVPTSAPFKTFLTAFKTSPLGSKYNDIKL